MANNDTTTVLNGTSVAGGDAMDESLVYQADGATLAKRPRVDLGYSVNTQQERTVDQLHPLPTQDAELITVVRELIEEVRQLRLVVMQAFD